MDAEQRAALEWAIWAAKPANPVCYYGGCKCDACHKWFKEMEHIAALQRLLDEKGGALDGSGLRSVVGATAEAASSTDPSLSVPPPPDSPAKIAADLREYGPQGMDAIPQMTPERAIEFAARIEALALEPGERVKIAAIAGNLQTLLDDVSHETHHKCRSCELSLKLAIAALTPIVERKP